jgi:dipeptide transport system permease protein
MAIIARITVPPDPQSERARYSLLIGVVSVSIGMLIGAIAGFIGGFVDTVLMRAMDVMLAIVISVLGFNIIGDDLREALDPKLRGRV